jgi:D-glycero-alpha-D-manno-heptose-7-phosphate kinase
LINDQPLAAFGELLNTAWTTKKRLSGKITNSVIDEYYACARQAGAIGGKLLGAGGGGFLLLFVEPHKQDSVARALSGLFRVSFGFDHTGSTLLFYQPQ